MPASDYLRKYQEREQVRQAASVPNTTTKRLPGTSLTKATPSLSRRIISSLPAPVRGAIDTFSDALFGNAKDKAALADLDRSGAKVPITTRLRTEGFLPSLGRSQAERIERTASSLERKGIDGTRASDLAFYDLAIRSAPNTPEGLRQRKDAENKFRALAPTDRERQALSVSRWLQAGEDVLDVAGVLPVGSIARTGGKAKDFIAASNKATSIRISEETREKALSGALESKRLTDEGTVTIYRAGSGTPRAGDFVTDSLERAQAYQKLRPGAQIAEVEVPKNTLIRAARQNEYLYVPTKERGFITSAKEVLPEADKIAGQYIPRSTDALSMKAANLVKDDIDTATRMALEGADDKAVATAAELLKHYARLADEAIDVTSKNALYDQAAEISNNVAKKLTEAGRTVQAASILGRLTPEGQLRFAAREIQKWNQANPGAKVAELSGEQSAKILEEMRAIQALPEGEERLRRFQALQKEIRALVPSRWWEKLSTVWKAGLLTGLKTTGLNLFANASHAATEIAKDVPAAGADMLLSLLTGKRTTTVTLKGLPQGTEEGARKGWDYLRTGFDERDIAAKLDQKQVNFKSKAVQAYVDGVFRLMGATDQPFYYGALKRSLYNQAAAQAKNQGLKGAERTKLIDELVTNPTEEMSAYALADAETAVFQNYTKLGELGSRLQRIPGLAFIIPFARTPSAVAMQVVNYSPAGAVLEAVKQASRKQLDQRTLAQAIGRSAVGTSVLYLGSELLEADVLSLDTPKTERERELWKLEGRKANSVKIGDEWRSVQTLGPAGPVLLMGGHFKNALQSKGSHTEAMIEAAFGTLRSFTEQTFLKGVNSVLEAISDPQRNAEFAASNFVSSFIPTIIADIARATDPKERRVESVLERVMSRLPILRQQLEEQISTLGEERDRIGNPLEVMLDPTRPSEDKSTPVVAELRRLTDAGFEASPTLLGDRKGYKALTQEQNTRLWKMSGSIVNDKLTALFQRGAYQSLDDEGKAEIVAKITKEAGEAARAETVLTLTQGLSGPALKKKLSELKEAGVLTEGVFRKYQALR